MGKPLQFEAKLSGQEKSVSEREYYLGSEGEKELQRRRLEVQELEADSAHQKQKDGFVDRELLHKLKLAKIGVAMFLRAQESYKNNDDKITLRNTTQNEVPAHDLTKKEQAKIKRAVQFVNKIAEDKEGELAGANDAWVEKQPKGHFEAISPMDSQALESKRETGKIFPPLAGGFIYDSRTIVPDGYSNIKKRYDSTIKLPGIGDSPSGEGNVKVSFSGQLERVPVPAGMEVVAMDNGGDVYQPGGEDPFQWVAAEGASEYILRESDENRYDHCVFKPSMEEQAYWQKVLPLPAAILKQGRDNPDIAPALVAAFIRKHFVYVCHDDIGDLFFDHKKDTALLVDELKMGHCDLLSWATAAYLRQMGLATIVEGEKVTNKSGTAFMKDYGHSRVAIIRKDGAPVFFDPTMVVEKPNSYNPDQLRGADVRELSRKLKLAKNEQEKRNHLRVFLQQHPKEGNNLTRGVLGQLQVGEQETEVNAHVQPTFSPRKVKEESIAANFEVPDHFDSIDDVQGFISDLTRIDNVWTTEFLVDAYRDSTVPYKHYRKAVQTFSKFFKKNKVIPCADILLSDDNFRADYYEAMWEGDFGDYFLAPTLFPEAMEHYAKMIQSGIDAEALYNRLTTDSYWLGEMFGLPTDFSSEKNLNKISSSLDIAYARNILALPLYSFYTPEFQKAMILLQNGELTHKSVPVSFSEVYDLEDYDENLDEAYLEGCFALNEFSYQVPVFMQEVVKAFKDESVKQHLEGQFTGIDLTFFANMILGFTKKNVPRKVDEKLRPQKAKEKPFSAKEYGKKFESDLNMVRIARKSMQKLLNKPFNKENKVRSVGGEYKLRPYTPGDDTRLVDQKVSARTGKLMVRQEKDKMITDKTIHAFFDVDLETYLPQAYFSNMVIVLEGLQSKMRDTKQPVYIASSFTNSYFKFSAKDDPRAIAAYLITEKQDPASDSYRIFKKEKGVKIEGAPNNLLYFTHHEGKAEAVKYLEKKTRSTVTATTFEQAGIQLIDTIKDSWVEGI